MRYSYEFKRKCVEMYRNGIVPDVPEGISKKQFQHEIRKWMRIEEAQGPEALKHKSSNKVWTPEDKLILVSRVIAGESNKSVAFSAGINDGMLYQWVRNYKIYGYNGLMPKQKGRNRTELFILMFLSKNPSSNCRRIGTEKRRCGSRASYLRILLTGSSNVSMRSFSKIKVAESRITTVWIQLSAENKVISDQINDLFPHIARHEIRFNFGYLMNDRAGRR